MAEIPETKYAKTVDGVNIAYQVRGEGPVDLVYIMGIAANFEIEIEAPCERDSSIASHRSPA